MTPQPKKRTRVFRVRLTCCGRDDGTTCPMSWRDADRFREAYLSGPGVDREGHKRSAVIVAAVEP